MRGSRGGGCILSVVTPKYSGAQEQAQREAEVAAAITADRHSGAKVDFWRSAALPSALPDATRGRGTRAPSPGTPSSSFVFDAEFHKLLNRHAAPEVSSPAIGSIAGLSRVRTS